MHQQQAHQVEDEVLLTAILAQQSGWRDLLSQLLQRHHSALLARCHAYLRNHEDAEDAAQETELRVYRAIRNFRGDASFRTWLFAIGERQCHDLVRRRKRHMIDDHLRALIEIHQQSLRKLASSNDQKALIENVLEQLAARESDIIRLRFYQELSLQEIATSLGLGLSATKMRLYRALEQFTLDLQQAQQA